MKSRLYIVLMMFMVLQKAGAQDYHLSQYDAAFQYMNPGMTGMGFGKGLGDYRINGDFRSQWRSVAAKPFTTIFLSYDMHHKHKWGVGGYLINNSGGAGRLN